MTQKEIIDRPTPAYSLALSGHAQAFFYGFDIRLHLPEMICISRLDVFSHAFDLFQNLRDCIGVLPHYFDFFQDFRGGFGIVSHL